MIACRRIDASSVYCYTRAVKPREILLIFTWICMNAQKWENVKTEIYGKVCLYNHMNYMTTEDGYDTPEIVYLPRKPSAKTARRAEMH